MTDKPYTDADVKLVAATFVAEAKKNPVELGTPPWLGVQTRMLTGPTEHDIARAVLDALAAAGRLAPVDDDPRHIIELRPDGWTIKHPLSCRLGDLFGCPVNIAAEDLDGPPAPPGRYAVTVDSIDARLRIGERVDQDATPTEDDPADAEADQVAVQNLLDDATRAFADAGTSSERVEVIRDLLASWYAAWPASAVTDEHEGIAHQLVALVYAAEARACQPGAGLADPEAASRVVAAAEALERQLWVPGLTEDDMTPEHRELAQALAAYPGLYTEREADGLDAEAAGSTCPCTCHQPGRCPCTPGAPAHRHGAGGYCTVGEPGQHHHVIAFAGDGTWSLEHPATCPPGDDPSATDWDCPVRRLAEQQITADLAALMTGGRYGCSISDLRDVFQLDDRLHDDQCTTPVCGACGCWCHAEEQTED